MSQLISDLRVEKKKVQQMGRQRHAISGILYISRQASKELHCFSITFRQLQIFNAFCYYIY